VALQTPTGTTLHLSTHSSWPPPNSGLAQFAVTVMPMPRERVLFIGTQFSILDSDADDYAAGVAASDDSD
jgi:hypothetical protein